MKNHIYVLPRYQFKEELVKLSEQQFMSGAFISIHDPELDSIIDPGPNVLNLWFHDTDPDDDSAKFDMDSIYGDETIHFDDVMAKQIFEFVEKNRDAKFWFVHCTAGICRSGAVGEFLSEYFEIPYNLFKRDNPQIRPNIHVKKLLRR